MKLKSLLKESKAWERKFGEPLPTLEDTAKAYRLKQEQEINERPNQDTDKVAKILGKSINDVHKFVTKHGIEADDLLDVIESGEFKLLIDKINFYTSWSKINNNYYDLVFLTSQLFV